VGSRRSAAQPIAAKLLHRECPHQTKNAAHCASLRNHAARLSRQHRSANQLRTRDILLSRPLINHRKFFGREPDSDNLTWRCTTSWPPSPTLLQHTHVVSRFSLIGPSLNLTLSNRTSFGLFAHTFIVIQKCWLADAAPGANAGGMMADQPQLGHAGVV
jgi:hypothetical protein